MYPKIKLVSMLVLLVIAFQVFGLKVQAATASEIEKAEMAQVQADDKVLAERPRTAAQQAKAISFWTRKAIASASPMELLVQEGPAEVDRSATPETIGTPGFASPGIAAPGADRIAKAAFPSDWEASGGSPAASITADMMGAEAGRGTSAIFTSYIVNQWLPAQTIYPHTWVGRFSFVTPNGTSFCSATSISNNIMLTAAHCVYDTSSANQFYTNKVFTPAYRNGSAPYGTFPTVQCRVLTTWVNLSGSFAINTWSRHDVAVCKMGTNAAGQTLNGAVGWMGRQWDWPYVRHYHDLGYPFRDTNDVLLTDAGKYLRTCAAESFQQTTETRGLGCDLSRGISGGPWVIGYAPNVVSGWADGVNSGFFKGTANEYSARFNSNNIVVLCNAAGC
jgi:hypothetical protein